MNREAFGGTGLGRWRERAASGYSRSGYYQNPSKAVPGEWAADVHNAGFMPLVVELGIGVWALQDFDEVLLFYVIFSPPFSCCCMNRGSLAHQV